MKSLPYEDVRFLEAPHVHNLKDIASFAALPKHLLDSTPKPILELLGSVQQSASILYASLNRLEVLYEDRFDRLCPSEGMSDATKGYVANLKGGRFARVTGRSFTLRLIT